MKQIVRFESDVNTITSKFIPLAYAPQLDGMNPTYT